MCVSVCIGVCVCTCTFRWAASTLCSASCCDRMRQDRTGHNLYVPPSAASRHLHLPLSLSLLPLLPLLPLRLLHSLPLLVFLFFLYFIYATHTHAHKLAHTCNVAHKAWLLNGQLDKGGAEVGAGGVAASLAAGMLPQAKVAHIKLQIHTQTDTNTHTHSTHKHTHVRQLTEHVACVSVSANADSAAFQ